MTDRTKESVGLIPLPLAAAIAVGAAGCTGPAELSSAEGNRSLDTYFERLDRQSAG